MFLPMVEGDCAEAAARSAAEFRDPRVVCFWDPERRTGLEWANDYQRRFADELTAGLAPGAPLRARIEAMRDSGEPIAMWDVAYFFGPRVRWEGGLPEPDAWTKQFGFDFDGGTGRASGTFWRSSSPGALAPSTWQAEFAAGMRQVSGSPPDYSPIALHGPFAFHE